MSKSTKIIFLSLTLLLAFIFSCTQTTPATKESNALPEKETSPGKPTSQGSEWDRILPKAKKEGKVILYSTTQPAVRDALSQGFLNRTGITLDIVAGRGGELSAKLLSERRAGLYMADFYLGGTSTLFTVLKPASALRPVSTELFLPEVLDTRLWYKGVLPFMDKEKMIMQTRMMPGGSQMDAAFNLNFVKKEELVSWYDLLQPKFKGKMTLQDPTSAGKGGNLVGQAITHYGLDWDYMRALAKQEPFITREQRLMIEWVARGKYIVAVNPDHDTFNEFKRAGVTDLESTIFKESRDILGGGSSGVALIANPPHPQGAKLFVNWFLSKEGQTIFARSYNAQSAREDVPTDHLKEFQIRKPNVEYIIEDEQFVFQEAKNRPLALEIFGPLIK